MEFYNTHISDNAIHHVSEVLKSTWLNEGVYVKEFEKKLASDFGLSNPLTFNSCTSALHLSLICAGVKADDEVILPAQTFIATGMAVLMIGAKPVFADIDPLTGNIDPAKIREKITDHTKAIIAVHWGGFPCKMAEIHAIAKEFNLEVIEDAAHAFGASINHIPIGAISKYTCFSFQAIKFITTGDGGLVCTTDLDVYNILKRRKWFGFGKDNAIRTEEGDRERTVSELGFKYHMNDVAASIGLGNLIDAKARLARRKYVAELYKSAFSDLDGITILEPDPLANHSYWLFTMLVKNRKDYIVSMKSKSIPVSVVDRRIDANPIFGEMALDLHGQEIFDENQISIPVHEALLDEDVDKIINSTRQGW